MPVALSVSIIFADSGVLFLDRKIRLTYSAKRANPVFGNILKRCSGSYTVIGISNFGVIYIPAHITNILFHIFFI